MEELTTHLEEAVEHHLELAVEPADSVLEAASVRAVVSVRAEVSVQVAVSALVEVLAREAVSVPAALVSEADL